MEEKKIDEVVETDVLIIGAGGAGLRAAISAAAKGVKTTVISKGRFESSGITPMAGADIGLDGKSLFNMGYERADKEDSKEKFFEDIVTTGFHLNNQELVELFVEDAPGRVKELVDWGMKINYHGEREVITNGQEIMKALLNGLKKYEVQKFSNIMVLDLLTSEGGVAGAIGLKVDTGKIILFKAKSVVLATGGAHQLYEKNSGSKEMTGDGIAMAYRAGAELINMEMVTFCNNTIIWPLKHKGSLFLYVFSMYHGNLLNRMGKQFIHKYYPPKIAEIATTTEWNKLFLSRACQLEIESGFGSPHGGVYFSIKDIPFKIIEDSACRQSWTPGWRFEGADHSDIVEELKAGGTVEVAPLAEYFEGGIKIDRKGRTTIKGLYAAGECTGGMFGANRVTAATTEMLVEGKVAGESAADYAKAAAYQKIDESQLNSLIEVIFRPIKNEKGTKPINAKKRLQAAVTKGLGIIRNNSGIEKTIETVEAVTPEVPKLATASKDRRYNKEWIDALELRNMVQVAEAIAKAAKMRTESRGVHFRSDFPNTNNDEWLKEIVVKKDMNRMELEKIPVTTTKIELPKGVHNYDEYILKTIEKVEEG